MIPGITTLQAFLFERAVQPVLYALGFMAYDEQAYQAVEYVIYAAIEIAVLYAVLRPLEAWRPVERWTDRREVRVDVLYTLLHRLGFVPFLLFVTLQPLLDRVDGEMRLHGLIPHNIDDLAHGVPNPLLIFALYVVILDFGEYVRHRLQHRLHWWWSLHALHHSQRKLSFWSDDRRHFLDDVITDLWFAFVGLLIGVPPGQFLLIVIGMRMLESLAHANLRLSFGRLGERLLVGPRFHRVHHGIGVGHEGRYYGCNFATLLPLWDILFRTADFSPGFPATGIRNQLDGADYGDGFWRQQALGLRRLWHALRPRRAG